jgi:hypothetical protein
MKTAIAAEPKRKIIYVRNATWWEYFGTLAEAKKLHNTCQHKYFDGMLGPQCKLAQERPSNFLQLDPDTQWAIDKNLGILDWDGEPTT